MSKLTYGLLTFLASTTVVAASLQDLNQTLVAANLTQLAAAILGLNSTTAGRGLIKSLLNENLTMFAPNDAAISAFPGSVMNDTMLFTNVLAYHVVNGNFTSDMTSSPNHTVGRTLLNASSLVELEGNKSQVLAWTKVQEVDTILNQATNVLVTQATAYSKLVINAITSVLTPPPNISVVLRTVDLPSLASMFARLSFPTANSNSTLLQVLEQSHGFTVFAPSETAFGNAARALTNLEANATVLDAIFRNHMINGTSVYMPDILSSSTSYTSAAGQPFTFTVNVSGLFITVSKPGSNGSASAKLIQTDVLVSNGVVHILDNVLMDESVDEHAASSAYASATSAASAATATTNSAHKSDWPKTVGKVVGGVVGFVMFFVLIWKGDTVGCIRNLSGV